jgi:hypothetical protein
MEETGAKRMIMGNRKVREGKISGVAHSLYFD